MVIGSSWPSDIRLLEDLLHDISVPLKFIIAPHLTDQNSLRGLENVLKVPYARFSQKENLTGIRILIVDTIGLLSSLYRYGKMAYVGGAFSRGIHNVLEPAVFGIPVLFGDHSSNMKYREVSGLINSGGGFPVANQAMVKGVIHRLLSNQELYHAAASAAGTYVVNNTGATDKIVSFIHRLQSPN
jgi:3-deoxy-D-manno-octulosonic-acid transferase